MQVSIDKQFVERIRQEMEQIGISHPADAHCSHRLPPNEPPAYPISYVSHIHPKPMNGLSLDQKPSPKPRSSDRSSAQSSNGLSSITSHFLLPEHIHNNHQEEDYFVKPGYETPQRTSAVDLPNLLGDPSSRAALQGGAPATNEDNQHSFSASNGKPGLMERYYSSENMFGEDSPFTFPAPLIRRLSYPDEVQITALQSSASSTLYGEKQVVLQAKPIRIAKPANDDAKKVYPNSMGVTSPSSVLNYLPSQFDSNHVKECDSCLEDTNLNQPVVPTALPFLDVSSPTPSIFESSLCPTHIGDRFSHGVTIQHSKSSSCDHTLDQGVLDNSDSNLECPNPYCSTHRGVADQAVSIDAYSHQLNGKQLVSQARRRTKVCSEYPWQAIEFAPMSSLGDGNEGSVLLATFFGKLVAVKVGRHPRIVKEQRLMSRLNHANILSTLGHSKQISVDGNITYAAVYEYCHHKDLMHYLARQQDTRSDVGRMSEIFDDILAALDHIHSYKCESESLGPVVHGDVKPENILIDLGGRAKLADFGLAQFQSEGMDVQGTPSYIAPEVVVDFLDGVQNPRFTTKSDIFSFGVLMVVALTGHYPFKRLTAKLHSGHMTASQIIKHFTPSRRCLHAINLLSPKFKRLVDACLCRYPEMRPTAAQLRAMLRRQSPESSDTTFSHTTNRRLPLDQRHQHDQELSNTNAKQTPRLPPSLVNLFVPPVASGEASRGY